jgi:ABC-type branched-subunit amino acid transport system substrate-binding protein/DNA-binding beta-propeller fold protein YncE
MDSNSSERGMKAAFIPGTTFAGYRVDSLVGRGGMGVVYRATDLSLERPVALKLIAPELAEDKRFRARFLREPRLAASLDHPNVIPIYEAGEHDGQLYLAMRFVEGSDLKSMLERERKLTPERTLAVLAQVAGALDAAHRRALVHRDVKPANVLIDNDGHVYLTDFGITKQLGGESTDTGRVVGTLDYLAPEQIRGDPVDGRTDCYALGCLLYECLAGAPPFRRATEAETLWAHMQEEPAPLKGHAALDPVVRKALAKDREDRYAACAELVEAAAAALGLDAPRVARRPLVPSGLQRRGPVLLAAGLILLAGVIALALVARMGGGEPRLEPIGNGVAAIDPDGGGVDSFTESRTAPGNVAVGEGAVWVLNNEERTVARIDPQTKEVTRTFGTRGVPSELAAGAGALWVGTAGGRGGTMGTKATVSVSRVDPESGRITRTVRLRGDEGVFPVAGTPRIAVGAGAVWAANPDGSVARIDPESGRIVATIEPKFGAWTIAAGEEGVWFLRIGGPPAVARIDPRTNRVTQTIRVGASDLGGVAVGAGSVWAAAGDEGVLWRIDPERPPTHSTIEVGKGVSFVAFGEGAVWAGNYVDGTVARIDPRTNRVAARTSVGAPQALAAGAGAAWVSVAGGATEGALTASGCGKVASGAGTADVLIASDLPLQGDVGSATRPLEGAIRLRLEQRGFRAGEYAVGYQSCDVSTPQTGGFEFRKCAANASAFAHAEQLVAVIGPYSSFCGQVGIPIMNRAPGGPLAVVSPIATHPGLTRGGRLRQPGGLGSKDEPRVYYPTGVRNFARLMAREDLQGVANAMLADELGLKRVYVLHDRSEQWRRSIHANPFRRAAGRLGIGIARTEGFGPDPGSQDPLADRVARSGAQGVFVAGVGSEGGAEVLRALRARLGDRIKIMASDPFSIPALLEVAGPAARGLYVSVTDVPPAAPERSPEGRRFARDFGMLDAPVYGVLPAAQATDLVLDAIARSDGTRESVLEELQGAEVRGGILGDFRLDRHGDITPAQIAILRVTGATRRRASAFQGYEGTVLDRVIAVPARLAD